MSSKEHFNEWMKQIKNIYYSDHHQMTEAYKKIQENDKSVSRIKSIIRQRTENQ